MFNIPKVNVIESDDGFSVEVLGRTGLRYFENGKSLRINSEVLAGPSGMIIYTDSIIRWESPNEMEEIDTVKRKVIVENIRNAFHFRDIEIQVS